MHHDTHSHRGRSIRAAAPLPFHPRVRGRRSAAAAALLLAAAISACAIPPSVRAPDERGPDAQPSRPLRPPIPSDSATASRLAPGIAYYGMFRGAGPWVIHVLDVDRRSCWTPAALKSDTAAVGRATVSAMLERVRATADTVAAVNGDFFLFTPPGVPTGAHVDEGQVLSGPGVRPVFVVDSAGAVRMMRLSARGVARARGDSAVITEWNHLPVTRLGAFDDRWGVWTDSSSGTVQVMVDRKGKVFRTVRGAVRAGIPRGGWVLAAGRDASPATRRWMLSLRPGNTIAVRTWLTPVHPRDAVGGFPMIVRDSAVASALDSSSVRTFSQARHPRTAIGMSRDGRRLVLVVVDGRQPGYSVGMSLPELAALMLELGTTEAMNLDGGGSSTMVVRHADGTVQVMNRPSDAEGERPVGNALAIVKGCGR